VNAVVVTFYRQYFGEGADSQLEAQQHAWHFADNRDGTCENADHAANVAISVDQRLSKRQVSFGDTLLQVSSKQVVVGETVALVDSPMSSESLKSPAVKINANSSGLQLPQSAEMAITVTPLQCNSEIYAPDGHCPPECPYFAQGAGKGKVCYFQCVKKEECGSAGLLPGEDIADDEIMICRKCKVLGCAVCAKGKGDVCAKCDDGYSQNPDGSCSSEYWKVWRTILTVAGVVVSFLLAWLVRLWLLPVTNEDGLREGLAFRSGLKLRVPFQLGQSLAGLDPDVGSGDRPLWPLSTNLHAVQVAGPGLTLHMNFQLSLVIWASLITVTWVIFTYYTEPEMLVLGLHSSETPQELCSVTLTGKEIQNRILPTKVVFLVWMYLFTFAFNFVYALYQRRRFLAIEHDNPMTDFGAMCTGLPELSGSQSVEDLIKDCIETSTKEKVVGVSVCWACKECQDDVEDLIDKEVQMLEGMPTLPDQATLDEHNKGLSGLFRKIDGLFFFTGQLPEAADAQERGKIEDMLKKMTSTDTAFVVFDTEAARNKAVQAVRSSGGIAFQDKKIHLSKESCEPDTIKWSNFAVTSQEFYTKLALGILTILVALLVWCFGFYLPFAYYQASFAKQGEEPGFVNAFIFSMLVVAGNQIMYFLCGDVAERVGFRFSDHQEALYIALYVVATMLNLVVDMVMEFLLAYQAAMAAGAHTADGRLLEDLTGFQEIFESYVMQKAVGTRLFEYCFPATFFIPFLMEPIFAIFLPYQICKLLLRTHPECKGREAEKSLNIFAPMDMARYGDLLLDFILSVLIVFFPPGTFLKMMLALVVCHVLIYLYDQYRILRSVPSFDYASDIIDRLVQILMGFPTAFLAAGIVFKGGCLEGSPICLKGSNLFFVMVIAFGLTLIIHVILIKMVVPMFDNYKMDHQASETKYSDAASSVASTWFSENAVHCLRSKYVYKHDPPCLFNTGGKQHLIKKNEKCGVHFECSHRVGADEYD
jgi:hypothetical protein